MKTLILHHDDCLKHDPGPRHVESPARINAVINGIRNIPGTEMLPAPRATEDQIIAGNGGHPDGEPLPDGKGGEGIGEASGVEAPGVGNHLDAALHARAEHVYLRPPPELSERAF